MKILFTIFVLLSLSSVKAYNFDFSKSNTGWAFWGSGQGNWVSNVGNKSLGSLWLSTDWSEEQTAHYKWTDLESGVYKVSVYVQAQKVGKGPYNTSFWHFYNGGQGVRDVFRDLNGNYSWRKIEYTVEVKDELNIWFRLKAPGQVWIDDFQITKVGKLEEKINITESKPLKILKKEIRPKLKLNKTEDKIILKNKRSFSKGSYLNFSMTEFPISNWRGYDRIELSIDNHSNQFLEFFLVLADNESNGYWNQLNHKTHLAPGKNELSFSLSRFVGERGSVRYTRELNLDKIQKFYIVADPDGKKSGAAKFTLNKMKLITNKFPLKPKSILAFDFTSQKAKPLIGITSVTSQDLSTKNSDFGFIDPDFWQIQDSQYVSQLLRYSIGLKKGKFRVKLPNGKYNLQLVVDQLGYWDAPFWQSRKVLLQGITIFEQNRFTAWQYLKDLLQFENVEPKPGDNPYDLYTKKLFNPIEKSFTVNNGMMELDFLGDASGIGLNSLFIWPEQSSKEARKYLLAIEEQNRREFFWLTRSLDTKVAKSLTEIPLEVRIVKPSLRFSPSKLNQIRSDSIKLTGGKGTRPFEVIQIVGKEAKNLEITISDLKSNSGEILKSANISLSKIIYQFTSPDLNHETYQILGKFLKPIKSKFQLEANIVTNLWIELEVKKEFKAGLYQGKIEFKSKGVVKNIPIYINVKNYSLPKVDLPVGFLGLDPLPHTYFSGGGVDTLYSKYRLQALNEIAKRGFNTYSQIPSGKINENDFDSTALDELFKEHKKLGMASVIFSYGSKFPENIVEKNSPLINEEVKRKIKSGKWPKIVYTFSDEASGYSNKVSSDITCAKKVKKDFPWLTLGGFSSMKHSGAQDLHDQFDNGLYSEFVAKDMKKISKNGKEWGAYNLSAGILDEPLLSFGPVLFSAEQSGLSYSLDWHLSAFHNYPYYDFDGRESDICMLYPNTDGNLYPGVKFEFAAMGLELYRKLLVLKEKSEKDKKIKSFLDSIVKEYSILKTVKKENTFDEFEKLNLKAESFLN